MFIIGIIIGYIYRMVLYIINLAIRFVMGFLTGVFHLIVDGENPFKTYWRPFVGLFKLTIVVLSAIIIWNRCADLKRNREKYIEQIKIEQIRNILKADPDKKEEDNTFTLTGSGHG